MSEFGMRNFLKKIKPINWIAIRLRELIKLNLIGLFSLRFSAEQARKILQFTEWEVAKFRSPSPQFVKQATIKRNCKLKSIFIETGTYYGSTTSYLSSFAPQVISIEPDLNLFNAASKKFSSKENITLYNGTSEEVFPELVRSLKGDVTFWLDGHFSEGATFQAQKDTPIHFELEIIETNISNFNSLCVLIDDFRCFNPSSPEYKDYPTKSFLVDWAIRNSLNWTVENDIFIARDF